MLTGFCLSGFRLFAIEKHAVAHSFASRPLIASTCLTPQLPIPYPKA